MPVRPFGVRLGWLVTLSVLGLGTGAADAHEPARVLFEKLVWRDRTAKTEDDLGRPRTLHLDAEFQTTAHTLLRRAKPTSGGIVLVEVATGRVLAATEIGREKETSLLFEPVAPAASLFKLVTTVALYERTSITPKTTVCTRGGRSSVTREHLAPARGEGASCAPFYQALGRSRNAVFAQLATRELTPAELLEVATGLGFNRPLALDARGTVGSLAVPDDPLDFARTAAGFSHSRLSVLGAAQLTLAIASGGLERSMQLARTSAAPSSLHDPAVTTDDDATPTEGTTPSEAIASSQGSPGRPPGPHDVTTPGEPRRLFSARTADRVTRAMEYTVRSGTAHDAFVDESGAPYLGAVSVAGKTGTLRPSEKDPTASWFVGFAPSRAPRVVVAVLLENSDLWHRKGHELARDLLRSYFAREGEPGVTPPLAAPRSSSAPLAARATHAERPERE